MLERQTLLHLSLIEGIGPGTISAIISKKSEAFSLGDLYGMSAYDIQNQCFISEQTSQKLVEGLSQLDLLTAELKRIERIGARWYTILDPEYPQMLSHIHLPPTILYALGAPIELVSKSLAIVGSRDATSYANRVINSFMPDFAATGLSIVSGGARGVDAFAHAAALEHGAQTIAVFGSGLAYRYPAANKKLFEKILNNNGILLSCFPIDTQPAAGLFPARNRIIAGLSLGTLVVQAAEKSGALITAHFALNQGREVCAVPGLIDEPLSAGCHNLIAQGAHIATTAQTVIEAIGCEYKHEASFVKKESVAPERGSDDSVEYRIIKACQRPTTIDEIAQQLGLEIGQLHDSLFSLMLEGKVMQNGAGLWCLS